MLIGHEKQLNFLKKSFLAGRLPQSLLFWGPSKIGKKTVALELAKIVNCFDKNPENRPCQTCQSCQYFQKGYHPDLMIVSQNENKNISIDKIKTIQDFLAKKPLLGKSKFVIIDDAERMRQDAQNRLLKTLEEPPKNSFLILITSFPQLILKTILSRCQKIYFSAPSRDEIVNFLKNRNIKSEDIKELIFFSFGRIGEIIEFLENKQDFLKRKKEIQTIKELISGNLYLKMSLIEKLNSEKIDFSDFLKNMLNYYRRLFIHRILNQMNSEKLAKDIENIQKTYAFISFSNINKRLALENLVLNF